MKIEFFARAYYTGHQLDELDVWVHRLDEHDKLPFSSWVRNSLREFDLLEHLTGPNKPPPFEDDETARQFLFKGTLEGSGVGEDYEEELEIDPASVESAVMPDLPPPTTIDYDIPVC